MHLKIYYDKVKYSSKHLYFLNNVFQNAVIKLKHNCLRSVPSEILKISILYIQECPQHKCIFKKCSFSEIEVTLFYHDF